MFEKMRYLIMSRLEDMAAAFTLVGIRLLLTHKWNMTPIQALMLGNLSGKPSHTLEALGMNVKIRTNVGLAVFGSYTPIGYPEARLSIAPHLMSIKKNGDYEILLELSNNYELWYEMEWKGIHPALKEKIRDDFFYAMLCHGINYRAALSNFADRMEAVKERMSNNVKPETTEELENYIDELAYSIDPDEEGISAYSVKCLTDLLTHYYANLSTVEPTVITNE